jgi:hypothetical protein
MRAPKRPLTRLYRVPYSSVTVWKNVLVDGAGSGVA